MAEIVGVRFKQAGKVCSFDTAGLALKMGVQVVVETNRGLELGVVAVPPKASDGTDTDLKAVIRLATPEDVSQSEHSRGMEHEALTRCREAVVRLGLPMKLINADYNLDASRLTVYFTAQGRVDFRDLVRQLAGTLKTRVELRQVGPRDEAKLCGCFGRCGRQLCCANFMTEFSPVSIKMAKEQDLPLNPPKISGLCGRLLCCLAYEYDSYHTMKDGLPKCGKMVNTPHGVARMVGSNVPKQVVMVQLESQAVVELPFNEVEAIKLPPKLPEKKIKPPEEAQKKKPEPKGTDPIT